MCNNLSQEKVIEILNDIVDTLALLENVKKLDEAKENVGNEMLKMMQFVFPVVMEIQMDVIKKHGLPEGREGLVKFTQHVRSVERQNSEISRLYNLIRSYYFPPISVNVDSATEADKTSSN